MYEIFADSTCIFDDVSVLNELKLIDPVLTMEVNSAGTLSFTMLPSNPGYALLERMKSVVTVYKNSSIIWQGRCSEDSYDFQNRRRVVCEGALAFLNDTTQPLTSYGLISVRVYLERILAVHNAKVSDKAKFEVGMVTVSNALPQEPQYSCTNFETTMECIGDKLLDNLGGYIVVRYENGKKYIDYLRQPNCYSDQTIRFGSNLLDFTRSFNASELCTVLVPFGAELDNSPISDFSAYLDVSSVNSGSIYVTSNTALASYGWIERVVHWDDEDDASNLLTKAVTYLQETQFETMQLDVSAIDLSLMDVSVDEIALMDNVRVISEPHGLDRRFPVMKLTIPLDQPEEAVYTLGEAVPVSLTATSHKENTEIMHKIEHKTSSILESARNNATELIRNATNGYVTIIQQNGQAQEFIISDMLDYENNQAKVWRWNINGLGYSSTGYNGQYGTAITMDGSIVADMITTGHLSANRIYGGQLTLGGSDNSNGIFVLNDSNGRPSVFMTNHGMTGIDYGNNTYLRVGTNGRIVGGEYTGSQYSVSDLNNENNYNQYAVFDANSVIHDLDNDQYYKGFRIKADSIQLLTPKLAVRKSMDDSVTATWGSDGTFPYVKAIHWNTDTGTINSVTDGYIQVINGIVTAY